MDPLQLATRSLHHRAVTGAGIVVAALAFPGDALADEPAIVGAAASAVDPTAWPLGVPDPGPLLLLLTAITLGVLARLAGPEPDGPGHGRRPATDPGRGARRP